MAGNSKGVMTLGTSSFTVGEPTTMHVGNLNKAGVVPRTVHVTDISLNKETLRLEPTKTETLILTVLPVNADDKTVTWDSEDDTIATVSTAGKVTAVAVGEADITATTTDGEKVATCVVTVANFVTGVTLDQETLALTVGGADGTLVATVAPANATVDTVTWLSSDEKVATVTNGTVKAVGAGEATITATTTDGGFTAECVVTVTV